MIKGIKHIRKLIKDNFVIDNKIWDFSIDIRKGVLYRKYNDTWQVIEIFLTSKGRVLCAEGISVASIEPILKYLERKNNTIEYNSNVFPIKPCVCVESILEDNLKDEKCDKEILDILDRLFEKIKDELVPSLNKIDKKDIEQNEYIIDLTNFVRSVDVFTYLRKKFQVTPNSIKNNTDFESLKYIAIYLIYNYSKDKNKILGIFDIDKSELDMILNVKPNEDEKKIINDFIQEMKV